MSNFPSLKSTTEEINKILLLNAIKDGIMSNDETLEDIIMNKRAEIIKEHEQHHSIWQNKTTKKWHTKLGEDKHMVVRKERGDLENAIIEYYITNYRLLASFSEVFHDWTKYMVTNKTHAMKTVNEYTNEYKRFLQPRDFVTLPMSQITEQDLVHLLTDIIYKGETITHKRFSSVKTIIRGVFNHAKTEMDITCISVKNIMDDLKFPTSVFKENTNSQNANKQVFKISEIRAIKSHLRDTTNLEELGVLLTIETGLRIGELATLKREDVDKNVLHIVRSEHKADFDGNFRYYIDAPKKNKCRDVILSTEAQQIIERILSLHESEWLFPSPIKGYEWNRSYNFDKTIRRICRELDIKERSMHKIRKTYSSFLLGQENVSDKLVQLQLGHSDIKTTHNSYYYDIYDDTDKNDILSNIVIG